MMSTHPTLRGFATISYWADDMEAAKAWYSDLLGIAPYLERPGPDGQLAYAEFRIGDYQHELGLIDRRFAPAQPTSGPGGAIMYWHVDDVEATLSQLKSMGCCRVRTSRTPGRRIYHGIRHGSIRQRSGNYVQCSLFRNAEYQNSGVTGSLPLTLRSRKRSSISCSSS
ncbi:VOC family protein [Paenibacillus sp. EZ-K15]|uniref:VOC family protein n=1 Tax=Paenibacillus sp. EZ-K15 TaxID=2044275 RepID=UPI000BF621AC|nr:VOC family protein [Paenibacillus sp. EZ-K15]